MKRLRGANQHKTTPIVHKNTGVWPYLDAAVARVERTNEVHSSRLYKERGFDEAENECGIKTNHEWIAVGFIVELVNCVGEGVCQKSLKSKKGEVGVKPLLQVLGWYWSLLKIRRGP